MNGVAVYGHWGRPVLAFPAERGDAGEFERHGMVGAVGDLLDAGRVKLYCVDSFDSRDAGRTRHPARGARAAPPRVRVVDPRRGRAVRPVGLRRGGRADRVRRQPRRLSRRRTSRSSAPTCSRSRSACRATTTRPRGTAGASAATPHTSTTRWTTSANSKAITSTGCAAGSACCSCAGRAGGRTRPARSSPRASFAGLLESKGIRCELDLWGHDVPHDWPSWRAQLAHHLPRFC